MYAVPLIDIHKESVLYIVKEAIVAEWHQWRAVNSIIKLTFHTRCFQMETLNELLLFHYAIYCLLCHVVFNLTSVTVQVSTMRATLWEDILWFIDSYSKHLHDTSVVHRCYGDCSRKYDTS